MAEGGGDEVELVGEGLGLEGFGYAGLVRRRLTSGPERSVCWPLEQRSLMVRTAARVLIVKRFDT